MNNLLVFCILSLFVLAACEKDKNNPEVQLVNGSFMTGNTTISKGGLLKFKWVASKGKADLESFTVQRNGLDIGKFPVTDIPADQYIDSTYFEGPEQTGDYTYGFIVHDTDGKMGNKALMVTVE